MNLFSKVGKEIIEEENKRESSFKESEELNAGLSVDYIAEIEDLKRSIVTLAKKIGNAAISNELGIPLDKIRDWTYQYANSLRLYRDSEETCEDDKVISSNKVVITKLGEESLTDATLEPIQDEKGILSFVINFDKYTLNVNSEEARKDCVRKLKMLTGNTKIFARELYQKPEEFIPLAQIILISNEMPIFDNNSEALSDRLNVINFTVEHHPND